jgi:hypothetical protein
MWPPPNIQSLPSKDEVQKIKEEISSMELEIIATELKLEALRKSVTERKAWIAPIRKLPHEVLSHIFVEVSMDDWKGPLILQGVSRWWRDVVVGSPRAWTFMPLFEWDHGGYSDLVSLFIERSRNATLHIYVRDYYSLPQVKILAHRIECMELYMLLNTMTYFIPREYNFTRLERLQLSSANWVLDSDRMPQISEWDMMYFPNLKFLHLAVWDPLLLAIATSPRFPLIRHLKVVCGDPSPLTDILVKCAKSLESIDLNYWGPSSKSPDTTPIIRLPFLKYIQLTANVGKTGPHWYIEGSTPNLEAYFEDGFWPTIDTFKLDVSNVTFLLALMAPDLSRFPRLVTLCTFGDYPLANLMDSINCMREYPQYSPDLAVIQYDQYISDEELEEVQAALVALAEETGRRIEVERIDWGKFKEIAPRRGWVPQPVRVLANGKPLV